MAYIPKILQTVGADLEGASLYTLEGKPYTGPYTQDAAGNLYTGRYITTDSRPLIKTFPEGDYELPPEDTFVVHYPRVTEKEREVGYMDRYFLQHPVTKRIKEVSKENFRLEKKAEKTQPYLSYHCVWYLSEKLIRRNEKAIEEGEKILHGIGDQVLRTPLQLI